MLDTTKEVLQLSIVWNGFKSRYVLYPYFSLTFNIWVCNVVLLYLSKDLVPH